MIHAQKQQTMHRQQPSALLAMSITCKGIWDFTTVVTWGALTADAAISIFVSSSIHRVMYLSDVALLGRQRLVEVPRNKPILENLI